MGLVNVAYAPTINALATLTAHGDLHLETKASAGQPGASLGDINSGLQCEAFSAYARARFTAAPGLTTQVQKWAAAPFARAGMTARLTAEAAADDPATLGVAMRTLRRDVLLTVMERDLAGAASLEEVTQTMTALAEETITAGVRALTTELAPRYGTPRDGNGHIQQLHVVGMGKLGGGELNVSSDIDLIFLYPEEGGTGDDKSSGGSSKSNHEYFNQLGKRLIRLLSDADQYGFVFRVDMRLRPWGDGPLSMSFDALENYLVEHGRDWERYAWIKGRLLTGDQGGALFNTVTPFVYRRYLDFGAVESLKGLHAEIRREVARRELADHVKLGPGGIREIEFIAQALQMIRGGRDVRLRSLPTIPTLSTMAALGLLPGKVVTELAAAYDFLRRVEHRLQYADDQQTHMLPRDDATRWRLAQSMHCPDWAAFETRLNGHRDKVKRHFEAILGDSPTAQPVNSASSTAGSGAPTNGFAPQEPEILVGQGFAASDELNRLIKATVESSKIRRLAAASRERFVQLLPYAIDAARASAAPDTALKRLLTFLEAVASRSSYLALLTQSRAALGRLAQLLAASEWAAHYLTTHPILLDELIDARTLNAAPEFDTWSAFAGSQLQSHRNQNGSPNGTGLEAQMNALREAHHAQVFRLLAQDLQGALTVEVLADYLSELADRTLTLALDECWRALREKHADMALTDAHFAIIAYGKLGSKELGYASDLDLVFIYDDAHERAAEIYARLAQRLLTFMETRTTAGRLFETDTRLRPDGVSGLLVTSLAAFKDYQENRAWLWEHQALTRARFCAGDAAIGQSFEDERTRILTRPREHGKLIEEVRAMRKKMHDGHPNKSPLFDLKHDAGGMVDIEFCVQSLVLEHARTHAPLVENKGNIALLGRAAEAGLIDRAIAEGAANAYRVYRRHQHALRLNNVEYARLPKEQVTNEVAAVLALRKSVLNE